MAEKRSEFHPYVAVETTMPEFTWRAVILGTLLGIIFGASSLYLTLKVGLTVSASIPVAVISMALFKVWKSIDGRDATILEHNIVQTTGSAGKSIAFGVGVCMSAILILGFDLEIMRVALVPVLGGLLGILMMIPLRRALIVEQHQTLKYPEGTACAQVLQAGSTGKFTHRTRSADQGRAHRLPRIVSNYFTDCSAAHEFVRSTAHRRFRIYLRHGFLSANGRNWFVFQSNLRHDDRHAALHLPDLFVSRLDRKKLLRHCIVRRLNRLRGGDEWWNDFAGFENRLPDRRNATLPTNRHSHRRACIGALLGADIARAELDRQRLSRRSENARRADGSELVAERDKSPGVLLASGYIAGGAIAGIVIAFLAGVMESTDTALGRWAAANNPFFAGPNSDALALIPFVAICAVLFLMGRKRAA